MFITIQSYYHFHQVVPSAYRSWTFDHEHFTTSILYYRIRLNVLKQSFCMISIVNIEPPSSLVTRLNRNDLFHSYYCYAFTANYLPITGQDLDLCMHS